MKLVNKSWQCGLEAVLFALLLSCGHIKIGSRDAAHRQDNFADLLNECPDRADSLYLKEMDALFRLVDDRFHQRLRRSADRAAFVERIEAYGASVIMECRGRR